MRRRCVLAIILSVLITVLMVGCGSREDSSKIKVVATLFPQYDFVRQIARDRVDLKLLINPGESVGAYNLSSEQIEGLIDADVVIYGGDYVGDLPSEAQGVLKNNGVDVISLSDGYDVEMSKEYLWTNPQFVLKMVDDLTLSLSSLDPSNASFFNENAEKFKKELIALDREIENAVSASFQKKIYFGEDFHQYYFMKRYGIDYAYFNNIDEAEQEDDNYMLELVREMSDNGIEVIFYEELKEPALSQMIAKEIGGKAMLFHSTTNISQKDFIDGEGYLSLMRKNLENLKIALG